jgi:hypothetical protein
LTLLAGWLRVINANVTSGFLTDGEANINGEGPVHIINSVAPGSWLADGDSDTRISSRLKT